LWAATRPLAPFSEESEEPVGQVLVVHDDPDFV